MNKVNLEGTPLVMLVDDNVINLQYLAKICEKNGYDYVMVSNSTEVLDLVIEEMPDIILLDVMMPVMNGFDLCRKIKSEDSIKDIPIIFITARAEIEDIIQGFWSGGVDYVVKPFNAIVLESRIRTHIELKQARDELRNNIHKLEEINRKLTEEKEKSEWLATRDFLTGAYNRRYIYNRIIDEMKRTIRTHRPMSLIMTDIDNFKRFNDNYGHEVGDAVLINFTDTIAEAIRNQDIVSRWGGEEFLMMLPDTDFQGATKAAEKISAAIQGISLESKGECLSLTSTFGVATLSIKDDYLFIETYDFEDRPPFELKDQDDENDEGISNILNFLVNKADEALLYGKRTGKNKVVGR